MDQPKIPTLKDSQKPQVKVRGLGGGLTLMDRMKQFKKKDLAFILAGLGTLFMAPLAEHFMMSPDNGDVSSNQFGSNGGPNGSDKGIFGVDRGGGPGDGTAPGGPAGGASDVITPLNVRDPSALIMGPGSASQPPVGGSAPSAPAVSAPSGHAENDVRDALAGAGVHAASAALGKTPLPVPKIGLSNNALRGLAVVSGGSSASAGGGSGLAAPGQASFGHGGGGSNMGGIKGGGNIASVGPRGQSQPGGSLDALKANAGKVFDRSDMAAPSTNPGSGGSIGNSGGLGSGQGAGSNGANDKAGAGNSAKESKSNGESLAYELMKQNLQKQLELYWKEKEAMDPTLELYKIRNSMAENIAGSFASAVGTWLGNTVTGALSPCSPSGYICAGADGKTFPVTSMGQGSCSTSTTSPGTSGGPGSSSSNQAFKQAGLYYSCGTSGTPTPISCTPYGMGNACSSGKDSSSTTPDTAAPSVGGGGAQGGIISGLTGPAAAGK